MDETEQSTEGAIRVLLNPYAGAGRATDPQELARGLASAGVHADVEVVEPGELGGRVRRLAGAPLVAVAGGDGSQRTAAGALVGSDTALAPVPTGRFNHFARRAGLDSIQAAGRAIRAGERRNVAVGRADGEMFLNTAVIGAYPAFIRLRERLRPILMTWPAAALASVVVLLRWPRVAVSVRTADRYLRIDTTMLWVGVGRDSFPTPHETPLPAPDGDLNAVILPGGRAGALTLARSWAGHRFRGRHSAGSGMAVLNAPWLELDCAAPITVALDGEPHLMDPPIRMELEPKALRLVVTAP